MGKNLLKKAGLVGLPNPPQANSSEKGEDRSAIGQGSSRPKTAPGAMMQFLSKQSSAVQETDSLKAQIAEFDGARPTRLLDPKTVHLSDWANRHEASFLDHEFKQLKSEIESSGGNIQPIKVRPRPTKGRGIGPSNPPESITAPQYELIFGSRRHRACLELGFPILAMIEDVSEQQLFVEMERENRNRKDLSAWEQGTMYLRALEQGLYPSNRKLSVAIGRDLGDVGRALSLARLPELVVAAFSSPLDLQYRWAKPLGDVQQKDPEGLMNRANTLQIKNPKPSAREIFEFLTGKGEGVGPSNPSPSITVKVGKKVLATIDADAKGKTSVHVHALLDEPSRKELAALLTSFLSAR